jgi:RNA polymerase sigma factor (TIGR02999 family)
MAREQEITALLSQLRSGDSSVADVLLPLVYDQLRELAAAVFSSQNPGHTLQPTALLNEAWLKLNTNLESVQDRRHFFMIAGRAMRQVLTDHARSRQSAKRGGAAHRVTFDTSLTGTENDQIDLIDLDDCLKQLAERNERHARVAELRLFSGLSIDETAQALELSPRTVDSDWAMAKAWLRRALTADR